MRRFITAAAALAVAAALTGGLGSIQADNAAGGPAILCCTPH
jgi:hypothetical protein